MATAHQIKAIYALASGLGINRNSHDDELHELVYCITGKESIKELTNSEANSVQTELMDRMKGVDNINRSGSKKKHMDVPPGKMTEAQQAICRARKASEDKLARSRKHESNLDRCVREADKLGMKYVEYMAKYRNDKFFSTRKIHISRNNVRRLKVN